VGRGNFSSKNQVLQAAFVCADSERTKKADNLTVFLHFQDLFAPGISRHLLVDQRRVSQGKKFTT